MRTPVQWLRDREAAAVERELLERDVAEFRRQLAALERLHARDRHPSASRDHRPHVIGRWV